MLRRHQARNGPGGPEVARRFIQRVNLILDAESVAELQGVASLRLHPLKGGRAGRQSTTLSGRWRLIFVVSAEGDEITIEEVSNHYGD